MAASFKGAITGTLILPEQRKGKKSPILILFHVGKYEF